MQTTVPMSSNGKFQSDISMMSRLFDSLNNGVLYGRVLVDDEGRPIDVEYLYMNDAYERLIPERRKDVIGRRTTDIYPIYREEPGWIAPYARAALHGEALTFERLWSVTGRWYNMSVSSPKPGHFVTIVEDIDDRKRTEEALRKSEGRFELLSTANSLLLSSTEPVKVIQAIGEQVTHLLDCDVFFNYVLDERSGRLYLNACGGVDPDTAESVRWLEVGSAICGCVARGGERIVSEDVQVNGDVKADLVRSMGIQAYACNPLRIGDKTVGTLSFGTRGRIRFSEEELVLMQTVAGQVSVAIKRKQAEDMLKQSDERLRAVVENSLDAVYRRNLRSDRYEYVSPAIGPILGFTAEEMAGMDMDEVMQRTHPDDREEVERAMARSQLAGMGRVEYRFLAKDERYRWLSDHFTVIQDANGDMLRGGVFHDVTESKGAEAALRASERRQRETNQELRRSNEELQQFAYITSHDMQEPLRMVTAYLSLLDRRYGELLGAEGKEYLGIAMEGSVRMRQLISDLLRYSRVETSSGRVGPVDMNAVSATVREDLRVAIAESGATVKVGDLPTVLADEPQMVQLLTNLISNAIKFRAGAAPRVEISARNDGGETVFEVRDNGIGVEPRYQGNLFKMFSRLHSRDEYPGTGIGLAISKKIVERHGGQIWLESDGRSGTTFFFTLPTGLGGRGHTVTSSLLPQ